MIVPNSIAAPDEEFSKELNAEWQTFIGEVEAICGVNREKAIHIENACRLLWILWSDEDRRQAMGWTQWNDLWNPGNDELQRFWDLIEDRIILNSESNRMRFYNLLLLDSDPTISEAHILREEHWTRITQFGKRISQLKDILDEQDNPEKAEKVKRILAPQEKEEKDPDPGDDNFVFKRDIGYWKGKQAVRIEDDSSFGIKLRSRFTLLRAAFMIKKGENLILATSDERTVQVGTILLPPDDEDYNDLMGWLNRRTGMQIV
jgi:hypothetical protein